MEKRRENEDKTLQMLIEDNNALMLECHTLKQQICGYKTSNANYRRTIESLKMDVNGLAEKLRVAEKNFNEIALVNTAIRTERDELNRKVAILEEEIEDLKKPWWKRIF